MKKLEGLLPSKQLPQVQTSNLTCSVDSPDDALEETLFELSNIKNAERDP